VDPTPVLHQNNKQLITLINCSTFSVQQYSLVLVNLWVLGVWVKVRIKILLTLLKILLQVILTLTIL